LSFFNNFSQPRPFYKHRVTLLGAFYYAFYYVFYYAFYYIYLVDTKRIICYNYEMNEAEYLTSNPEEKRKIKVEQVQDGDRFSQTIGKITRDKVRLTKAKKLKDRAFSIAIDTGVKTSSELLDLPKTDETIEREKAEKSIEKVTDIKITQFESLSEDDVDFINGLPEDGSKAIVIKELFSTKIAKEWRKKERIPAKNAEKKLVSNKFMKKFVKLYIDNNNKLLEGKSFRSLRELKTLAGYSEGVNMDHVLRLPWVSLQIANYHKANESITEYHIRKQADQDLVKQSLVDDITVTALASVKANPAKLLNSSPATIGKFLRDVNEIKGNEKEKTGPTVAIQINGDVASRFQSQNEEKKEHFANSF